MKVVRVYHAGRDSAHRERELALMRAGAEVTLVVPANWTESDDLTEEPFEIVELPVRRRGDVNRHSYEDPEAIVQIINKVRPDIVDLHEEPFSRVVHQLLSRLPTGQKVVTYAAQNIDKRFPPPFAQWERQALGRIQGVYPCTRQAASVLVGKGFAGAVNVMPLAVSSAITPGAQKPPEGLLRMLLVGRLVPEKGVLDAVRVLAAVNVRTAAQLELVGAGPEAYPAAQLAMTLGVGDKLRVLPWRDGEALAECYRRASIVLIPSGTTRTWVEQFGRVVVEAQAAGAVVVGYASGSLPEVVGGSGLLVAEGDVTGLIKAAELLTNDAKRWSELREAGFAAAHGRTWDAVAQAHMSLYRSACDAKPRTRVKVQPRRREAVARYGEPARLAGMARPFALPGLRNDLAVSRALGRALDAYQDIRWNRRRG